MNGACSLPLPTPFSTAYKQRYWMQGDKNPKPLCWYGLLLKGQHSQLPR